jgi:hypothetical protein
MKEKKAFLLYRRVLFCGLWKKEKKTGQKNLKKNERCEKERVLVRKCWKLFIFCGFLSLSLSFCLLCVYYYISDIQCTV